MNKLQVASLLIAIAATHTSTTAQSSNQYAEQGRMCLEHIKPLLKDPESAYVRDIQKDGTVYQMTLYAKNSYGGINPRQIACEIKNNKLDADWTKIHLQRLGW